MLNLIKNSQDQSLSIYEKQWIDSLTIDDYKNPTLTLYTSMVFGFANHLPYSMDIEQPEYVPSDFFNMEPIDVETNDWFKYADRRTFFNSMISWGDSFKTGILLQICSIFQKMLLGKFPENFELKEEYLVDWGIDKMTHNMEYNRCFFEILKSLPFFYTCIINSKNNEERRNNLNQMYESVADKIAAYRGYSTNKITINPSWDVKMRVYWEHIVFYDGIKNVVESIKKEQLKYYNLNNKTFIIEHNLDSKNR